MSDKSPEQNHVTDRDSFILALLHGGQERIGIYTNSDRLLVGSVHAGHHPTRTYHLLTDHLLVCKLISVRNHGEVLEAIGRWRAIHIALLADD